MGLSDLFGGLLPPDDPNAEPDAGAGPSYAQNVASIIGGGLLTGDRYHLFGPGAIHAVDRIAAQDKSGASRAALTALLIQAGYTPEQAKMLASSEGTAKLAIQQKQTEKNAAGLQGILGGMPKEDGSDAASSPSVTPPAPRGPAAGASLGGPSVPVRAPGELASLFDAKEKQYGLPPGTLHGTADIETGGKFNADAHNNSGADGIFQFMPGTAKEYGVNTRDVESSTDGAARLARDNMDKFRAKVGREPTPAELYMLHQQGAGGIGLFLSPDKPAKLSVPSRNILANGGDPEAPASEFIKKFTTRFRGGSAQPARAQVATADAGAPEADGPPGSQPSGNAPDAPSGRPIQVASTDPKFMPQSPSGAAPSPAGPVMPVVEPSAQTEGTPGEKSKAAEVEKQAMTVLNAPPPSASYGSTSQVAYAKRIKSWAEKALVAAPALGEQGKGLSDLAKSRLEEANKVISGQMGQPFKDAEGNVWQVGPNNEWKSLDKAKDERTPAQKDLEYLKIHPELQAAYDHNKRISTQTEADPFNKKAADLNATRLGAIRDAGDQSQVALGDFASLRQLSASIGDPGKAAESQRLMGPYLQSLGLEDSAKLPVLQQYNAIIKKLAPQMHVAGSGATDQREFQAMLDALGDATLSSSARSAIHDSLESTHRYNIARADIADRALSQGSTDSITPYEASKQMRALPNPMQAFKDYKKEHPEEFPGTRAAAAEAADKPPATIAQPTRPTENRTAQAEFDNATRERAAAALKAAKTPEVKAAILKRLEDAGVSTYGLK